jgi:plastocyanin
MNGILRFDRAAIVVPAFLASLALIAALVFAWVGAVAPASAQSTTVEIVDFAFSGNITVTAGSTVTWVNNGAAPHTATGDGGEFDTGTINAGGSASITFDTPGTYTYHCEIHPAMTASITVISDTAAPTATTAPAAPTSPTTGLPSTGTGAATGSEAVLPLAAALLVLTATLGVVGLALRRRSAA